MPKGAIHHMHTTAAPPTETYIEMTYEDITYYNERENMFRVFPKPEQVKDGYIRTVDYRRFSSDPKGFDDFLRSKITIGALETDRKESHDIWKEF
jgi:hypothetical protein